MTKNPPILAIKPERSIRWKLAAAFIAVAGFVAVFVGVAIAIRLQTTDRAARLEAGHVAAVIADAVADSKGFRPHLQEYVSDFEALRHRDVVIVDSHQMGLADENPDEIGMRYDHDPGNEVGRTIGDGKIRTFVETNSRHPDGILQLVVPIRQDGVNPDAANIGAVIIEYSLMRDELFAAERQEFYLITAAGIAIVLLVTLFGLGIARAIAKPLVNLKDSAVRIAAHDYEARVAVTSRDEIGQLGSAFNQMAEDLGASHAALVEFNNRLDLKVDERTKELSDSAIASLNMMEDAILWRQNTEQAREKLDYLASFDPTTGLANQSLFLERLQSRLLLPRNGRELIAVCVLDIQRFKTINDALGRKAGDELLRQVAGKFVEIGGDATRFARVGPDRFAIVLPALADVERVGRYVEQRLDETFGAPFRVADNELRVSMKMGIALFPDDGANAETLLRNAEAALKKAKSGGDRYVFFTEAMTARVVERLSLENRLRDALDNEEFVLHYQPKVSLASGLVISVEALIRWNDPKTGLVPPLQFIPILEETGLIHEVGRWAMRKAIEDHLRWRNAGLGSVRIAVNVSPLQLRNRAFVAEVEQALGVDANAAAGLELEITESLIMEDVKHSSALLLAIRAMGVTIAIDDFGTGYSSLSYLSKLPVDTLKIDRAFVNDMSAGPDGLALVSTIISLAHSLKLKVVAEGVETEEQARLLRLLKCDEMQGYLFSKPVPVDVFEARFLTRMTDVA
jgi:diguanylate cyclase (GGDEF)-like protein